MKTRLLIIIGLSVTLGISFAYAVPELDYSQAFEYSDFVIMGKIVFVDIISEPIITRSENTYSEKPGVAMYEIEIFEFKKSLDPIKNPVDSEFIIVPGTFLREPHAMSYDTYPYEVGQIGTFYIQKNHVDYIDSELIIRSGVSKMESELVQEPTPNCPKGTIIQNDNCITPTTFCGEGTTYHDGLCLLNQIEKSNQNDKWPAAYQDISNDSEPIEPTISDEQEQMIREYCRTGIRHPDMMGIPQCIKEPELMEPLAISIIGGVISTAYALGVWLVIIFPVVYFVAKRKNIPSKPYLPLIISGILLYYGTINLFIFNPRLPDFLYPDQDIKLELIGHLVFSFWIPIINYVIAGILLYKSSVIRKLIKK